MQLHIWVGHRRVFDTSEGAKRAWITRKGGAAVEHPGGRRPAAAEPEAKPRRTGKVEELKRTRERAWTGKQDPNATRMGKQEAGALGEEIALAYIRSLGGGREDARALNMERSNFPVDLVGDHEVYEIKTGQVSNSPDAQKWRATIGQPGKAETAWLKTASAEAKSAWNARKQAAIMERKAAAVAELSKKLGHPLTGKTVTVLLHPDKGIADIHVINGFHRLIGYNSEASKNGYVGSFQFKRSGSAA